MTMQIDAHQHYWEPRRGDYDWMDPDDAVLSRKYMPADLAASLAKHGIARTVLVQAAATIPPALWADMKAQGLMREDAPTE